MFSSQPIALVIIQWPYAINIVASTYATFNQFIRPLFMIKNDHFETIPKAKRGEEKNFT